jgi:cytoskeletal protein CcmA (bactofilin family)
VSNAETVLDLKEASMFGKKAAAPHPQGSARNGGTPITLLTIAGDHAKVEGKFEIVDSIQIECEVGGELDVGGRLVIGQRGVVTANVRTVDAVILGRYEGNLIATGNVEIAETGRVSGNIQTDSLVISKGGFFNGTVTKINDDGKARPVYLVDDRRAGHQR